METGCCKWLCDKLSKCWPSKKVANASEQLEEKNGEMSEI